MRAGRGRGRRGGQRALRHRLVQPCGTGSIPDRTAGRRSVTPGAIPRRVAAVLALLCAAVLPLLSAPLFLPTDGAAAGVPRSASAGVPTGAPSATGGVTPTGSATGATPTGGATSTGSATGATPTGGATASDYPYVGYLRTTITGITPTVITSTTGPSITVTGTMTNTSKGTIYDLRYVWERGDALASVTAIKAEIARPTSTATVVGEDSRILAPTEPPTTPAPTTTPPTSTETTPTTTTPTTTPAPATMTATTPTTPTTKQVDLAPGATAAFVASIAVGSTGLKIGARGVYPLTIKVTGDIGQNGYTQYERVGEIYLLGTVLSVPLPALPGGTPAPLSGPSGTPTTSPTGSGTTARPVPATVLWPLVDTPHLGVDGVFLDDSLATTLAPGGRLFGVLSALSGFSTAGAGVTLMVDPQLLDEIQTMVGGYRVVATPGAAQAALTPSAAPTSTSSGSAVSAGAPVSAGSSGSAGGSMVGTPSRSSNRSTALLAPDSQLPATTAAAPTTSTHPATPPPAGTIAGTGSAVAAAFLTRLRAAVRTHQVLVLPYSDPDSVAMVRAGLDDQLAALITRGDSVATRVLQLPARDPGLITDTLVPVGGAVNDATLTFLSGHGITHAVLSPTTVHHTGGPVGAVSLDQRATPGARITAALTDADVLPQLTNLVAAGRTAGLATRLTTTAALLTGGSLDGTGTPLVFLPDRRWTADATGLSVLSGLLQTLATGGVLAPRALPAVTARATTSATLAYSGAAEIAELPPDYLAQVAADNRSITAVGGSLVQARALGSPVPADLLTPLRTALASASAAALRTDPAYGFRILHTVGDTLDGLRSGVSIVSQSPSMLAASTAPLLITVQNDLPYGVRVKVVVIDGESVGMTTKDPALEDIPEGSSHQFRIDASVVKAGRFQVHARIQAADGSDWSAPTTITVSSSAYGVLTVVLVAVAGAALTLMVALRLVQRIRNRNRAGADPAPTPGVGAPPEPDSILAAANESTAGSTGAAGEPGNPAGGDASVSPASPTAMPSTEQGEPPR